MNACVSNFANYPSVRDQWHELALGPVPTYRRDAPDLLLQRLTELHASAPQASRINIFNGNLQHFLGPETAYCPQIDGIGFLVDDVDIYKNAVRVLRGFRHRMLGDFADGKDLYSTAVLSSVQSAVERYFGPPPDETGMDRRYRFLTRHIDDPMYSSANVSIAALKRRAACSERSAAANNILHMFGYAPVLETGFLQIDNGDDVLHAFLITRDNDGLYLYDPTNPHYVVGRKQRIIEHQPAIYEISDLIIRERSIGVGGHRYLLERTDNTTIKPIFQSHMTFSTSDRGKTLQPI